MKLIFVVFSLTTVVSLVYGKAVPKNGTVAQAYKIPPKLFQPQTPDDAKKFLVQFGFMPKTNTTTASKTSNAVALAQDPQFVNAIKAFQKDSGLAVTGQLDKNTKAEMAKPRCGILKVEAKNVANAGSKWSKNRLSYNVNRIPGDLEAGRVREAIRKAFNAWSAVVPLDFFEVGDSNADIRVSWEPQNHGDGAEFSDNVLAHAFFPEDGKLHYNERFSWAAHDADRFKNGFQDVFVVATHEIGHAIGIDHISDGSSIMRPALGPNIDGNGNYRFDELSGNDIGAAQNIYGARNGGITTVKFFDEQLHRTEQEMSSWVGNTKDCSNYLAYFLNDRLTSIDTGGQCIYLYEHANCEGERIKVQPNCGPEDGCCPHHFNLGIDCNFNDKASSHQLC